jgi:hypothetical protein
MVDLLESIDYSVDETEQHMTSLLNIPLDLVTGAFWRMRSIASRKPVFILIDCVPS